MTRQQAGVSAEAVAKLVAEWRATHDPGEPIGSKAAYKYDVQRRCADELEAALRQGQAGVSAEALAQRFHYLYESLAPQFGYETRKDSAVAWEKVPEKNRKLMIAVCEQLLATAPPEQADS